MGRPARPWFRLYVETIWDPKIRRLPVQHRWCWIAILALARQSPQPGRLVLADTGAPLTVDDVADAAAVRAGDVRKALDALSVVGAVAVSDGVISVTHWDDRQFDSDIDTRPNNGARTRIPHGKPRTKPQHNPNRTPDAVPQKSVGPEGSTTYFPTEAPTRNGVGGTPTESVADASPQGGDVAAPQNGRPPGPHDRHPMAPIPDDEREAALEQLRAIRAART